MLTLLVAAAIFCWLFPKITAYVLELRPKIKNLVDFIIYLAAIFFVVWCIYRIINGPTLQ